MNDQFIEETVQFRNSTFDIQFEAVDFIIGNSGIGSYECHGVRGFDSGVDFVESFGIQFLEVWSDRQERFVEPSERLKSKLQWIIFESDSIQNKLDNALHRSRENDYHNFCDYKFEMMRESKL